MQSRVQKWGNSLALRIPRTFAVEIGLADNTPVEITLEDGRLVIVPLTAPRYSLDELLAGVTTENLHTEHDTGVPEGNELW
ncbi:MAG: AbrB/MazE/SpoVT family DNA-binding domain-containing protein [Chloroflexaceae bacterium]|nr:AbrB/MazE/SpoVT family DNA-binding domain-containing protein [Chloroflexaceae bacterium]